MDPAVTDIVFAGGDIVDDDLDRETNVATATRTLDFVAEDREIAALVNMTSKGLGFAAPLDLPPEMRVLTVTVSRPGEPRVEARLVDAGSTSPGEAMDLRTLGLKLPPRESALAARAAALLNWHRRARHCPNCGMANQLAADGVARHCVNPTCRREHFPRLDLVVMTLPVDGDRCLLGHQPRFPLGLYSGFAGFAEPGETLEQAARRETREEAGVELAKLAYRFSQPWPFPHAITIGFRGLVVDPGAARADLNEIAEVRWFHRTEIAEMLERTDQAGMLRMPGRVSLAHQLARDWLAEFGSSDGRQ